MPSKPRGGEEENSIFALRRDARCTPFWPHCHCNPIEEKEPSIRRRGSRQTQGRALRSASDPNAGQEPWAQAPRAPQRKASPRRKSGDTSGQPVPFVRACSCPDFACEQDLPKRQVVSATGGRGMAHRRANRVKRLTCSQVRGLIRGEIATPRARVRRWKKKGSTALRRCDASCRDGGHGMVILVSLESRSVRD